MLNFCTLFDSHYLLRGLTMYQSLSRQCHSFHLYIFAFNDLAYTILTQLQLENVTVIPLKDFEDKALLSVKPDRNIAEYCWTCTSSTILHCIEKYELDHCTYLDADLYFFSDPIVLIEEMGSNDILITEHRYSRENAESILTGKYCVQFITFKNTDNGMKALHWWRNACLEWCYARYEDGKFGDQKYLDDWTTRFEGVHELQHLGGGAAPWNIQQYESFRIDNLLYIKEEGTEKTYPLVFYHFHFLKFYQKNVVDLGVYKYSPSDLDLIYTPYIREIDKLSKEIAQMGFTVPYKIRKGSLNRLRMIALKWRRKKRGMDTYKMNKFLK